MSAALVSTRGMPRDRAIALLDTAEDMADTQRRAVRTLPTLRGRTVVTLFFEDSTRTRISFEVAAKRLSADVIDFAARGSSVSKGEGLQDTVQTLSAMGAEAFVLRHPASGAAQVLAASGWTDAAVVNAGDGTHEHPTQALLDAFTIRRRVHGAAARGRGLDGLSVVIVGDVLHSRVARSNLWLLTTLGAAVTLLAPPTLMPVGIGDWPAATSFDLDAVLATSPDVVMMLRVQRERMGEAFFPSAREYAALYGLSAARADRLPAGSLVMHPGPMNRGLEIAGAVADSPRSTVLEQVEHGIATRMAVLYDVLAGQR